jgi:hypothetical protein
LGTLRVRPDLGGRRRPSSKRSAAVIDEQIGRRGTNKAEVALSDRRQSERFSASEDQAWVGWWEGRLFRKSPATLINISQGGAMIVAGVAPPRRATAWVCLEGPNRSEWVEGMAIEVTKLDDGTASVRLAFRELCPYSFFEVAIYGPPSPEESGQFAAVADPAGRNWW